MTMFNTPHSTGRAVSFSPIGQPERVNHPANCKTECCYGYDKAYCFPCMKKILGEMPIKERN